MSKLIRTALAAFAAVGVLAVTGVGVASAAAVDTASTWGPESIDLRLPGDGRTVAQVKYTGGSTWRPTEHDMMCEGVAEDANQQIAEGYEALYSGNMAAAAEAFGSAVKTVTAGEAKGCELE